MTVRSSAAPISGTEGPEELLDKVFFALSASVRRRILERLEGQSLLVSELAEPFDMSLQAVSQHIQLLANAGLIHKERTGRISRCSLTVGSVIGAAVWMNRYSKYWRGQFNLLAATLHEIQERPAPEARKKPGTRGKGAANGARSTKKVKR